MLERKIKLCKEVMSNNLLK